MLPSHISAYMDNSQWEQALNALDQGLATAPRDEVLLGNKGICLRRLGRYSEAEKVFRRILELDETNPAAWNSLGNLLKEAGKIADALPALEKAARLGSRTDYYSDWLFALNYSPSLSQKEIFEAHRAASARMPDARSASFPPRQPGRLRVGLVSADFCRHSVSYFLRPLLTQLDRSRLELFCYSDVARPDNTTELLRASVEQWREIHSLGLEQVADLVRRDGIDVLIDLSGHTGGNRLPLFAKRAAPLQLSWLGYPNTTGLETMDFRLVDSLTDPEGSGDEFHSEQLLRLDGPFVCYEGVALARPSPREGTRPFTFGCFNYAAKLNEPLLELWAELLERCPGARLLLKNKALSDATLRDSVLAVFTKRGVEASRIELRPPSPSELEHLNAYGDMDLALDTDPYNGTTTTCEALWMGVPVLTLAGDRHASRVGRSLLTAAGLGEWIASSRNDYLGKAVAAFKGELCPPAREVLRAQLLASPLCDAPRFAERFSSAIIQAWEKRFGALATAESSSHRRVLVNGAELKLPSNPGPSVFEFALALSQTMPAGRILVRALADGRELGGDDLEKARFDDCLELVFAWDENWLLQRRAELTARMPELASHATKLAGELAGLSPEEKLRGLSAFLEALSPVLEYQAQFLDWQTEAGVPACESPLASRHEKLASLVNELMDLLQPPRPGPLSELLEKRLAPLLTPAQLGN